MPAPRPVYAPRGLDAWPPTQVRLQPRVEHDDAAMEEDRDLSFDDDPLTYFLSPTPLLEPDDEDDYFGNHGRDTAMMDFDFDAGIEDAKHPPQIVRSVSPSSLDGLSLPAPRPPTPPRSPPARLSPDPESATDDEDEDGEDYIRFGTGRLHAVGYPFTLGDFAAMKAKKVAKGKVVVGTLLRPPLVHAATTPSSRGRPTAPRYGSSHGGTKGISGRRLSPHAWREPSPDVWSIEEETEGSDGATWKQETAKDNPAAKPRKRVRFVLPVKE